MSETMMGPVTELHKVQEENCHLGEALELYGIMLRDVQAKVERLRNAAALMHAAATAYPAEVLDSDGSWRIGGAAREAWQHGLDALRDACAQDEER
jgi:hypothetical protein